MYGKGSDFLVKYYRSIDNRLCEVEDVTAGTWISVINPTETEISDIEEDMGIDRDYIRAALDEEEPSRIESDDGVTHNNRWQCNHCKRKGKCGG